MLRIVDRLNPQALRILALLIVLVAVLFFFAAVVPNYLNGRLFNRVSSSVAIMALIATAQTLVIITREHRPFDRLDGRVRGLRHRQPDHQQPGP